MQWDEHFPVAHGDCTSHPRPIFSMEQPTAPPSPLHQVTQPQLLVGGRAKQRKSTQGPTYTFDWLAFIRL